MSSDSIVSVVEVRGAAAAGGGDEVELAHFLCFFLVFSLGGARPGAVVVAVVRN